MKNLVTIVCLVIFILASQQPSEAGTLKRAITRTIKWGVCFPAACVTFCHAILPALAFQISGASIGVCDLIIEHDLAQEAADEKAAEAAKKSEVTDATAPTN